jgi:tetratricopeptide (TPR) repeat protein
MPYLQLGRIYMAQNKPDQAIAIYQKALAVQPNSPGLNMALGNIYLFQNNLQMARQYFEKANQLAPNDPLNAGVGAAFAAEGFHVVDKIKIGGAGGWDYLTMDSANHRLYVSHNTLVEVVDTNTGKVVGQVADTQGVHGIALAPDMNKGFTSNGRTNNVTALGNDLNGVKSGLDTTNGNLQQLRGEHGELIARNHEELEQLKRMGERDYYEFTLTGKGQKEHVGSTMIEFRSASAKKHQYTIELYVDDTKFEKKNRAVDEPIYFYAGGSRQPMELVVNQVTDKKISGYLSAPKAIAASASTSAKAN